MMDANKIRQKLKGEADRKAHTFHISQSIFAEFRKACEPYSASRVIEEMMKEYIESAKVRRPIEKSLKKN